MSKRDTYYLCNECGHQEPKWLGQCPGCGAWNSLVEVANRAARGGSAGRGAGGSSGAGAAGGRGAHPGAVALREVTASPGIRRTTGIGELDRVLGGGAMAGATVLFGGEPGIGKSTLMLQAAASLSREAVVLYISGEESAQQIRLRSERLGAAASRIELLCETNLNLILNHLARRKPEVIVIDSVQTMFSEEAGTVPGTVGQIKYATHELVEWTRGSGAALFMVAHVTKEGSIAGPKAVEHMVDAVLFFDHADNETRFLRATKNRFGSTDEVGLFTMGASGLSEVTDPSSIFLVDREGALPSGVVVAPVYEGSRVLLVELQALTVPAKGGMSRVFAEKVDGRRVSRMAAVLEKHVGMRFSDQDVYVNVAGGMRIDEVAVDLPLAVALYAARSGLSVPPEVSVAGEVTLAGEIRPIGHLDRRIRTARELGFSRLVGPSRSREGGEPGETGKGGPAWIPVRDLSEAIKAVFGRSPGA
ncbi:MAG: DNA repair protein RadA [Spirochaetaceae bacterium]